MISFGLMGDKQELWHSVENRMQMGLVGGMDFATGII